jgi:hypothetical protein
MENPTQLKQFREQLYQSFEHCADGLMELVDALSSQTNARTVVELSLEPAFQRSYNSVYQAIDGWSSRKKDERLKLIAAMLPEPADQPHWLLGTDITPMRRQYARTLKDRGYVYFPNAVAGNKPVTIGHQYSLTACLPERAPGDPPWVVPLVSQRVTTQETESEIGLAQLMRLMEDEGLPWHKALTVHVGDSRYSTPDFLFGTVRAENLITVSRLRSNRTLYQPPPPIGDAPGRGHPIWYGEKFKLADPATWPEPDEVTEFEHTSHRGKCYTVHIEAWNEVLMRGTTTVPMHRCPFRLIRITWLDTEGQPAHKRPLWLAVSGERRHELSSRKVQAAYAQRFDLEHFFRFGKQRLLFTRFQTPDVQREENWWQIVLLAYTQLWLARDLVDTFPHPWERYLPVKKGGSVSPAAAQRGFGRLIRQFGSPAKIPKHRGYSPGRSLGTRLPPRPRHPVVRKSA